MAEEEQEKKKEEISPEELIKVNNELDNKLIKVAAYSMFYNAKEGIDELGESTAPYNQSEWVRHRYVGYFSLKLRPSGKFAVIPRYLDHIVQHFPKSYENNNIELKLRSLFGGHIYNNPPQEIGGKKQLVAAIDNGTYEYDLRQDTFTAALIPQDANGTIYGEAIMPELFKLGQEKGLIPKDSVLFDNVTIDPLESEFTAPYVGKDHDQRIWQVFKAVGPYKPISGTFASEDLKKFNYEAQKMMDRLEFMKQMEDINALRLEEEKLQMQSTAAKLEALEASATAALNKKEDEDKADNKSIWPIDSRRNLKDTLVGPAVYNAETVVEEEEEEDENEGGNA